MKLLISIFILANLVINSAYSHESRSHDKIIDKWYFQMTIGKHFEKYYGELDATIERIKANTKSQKSQGEINLIGLYLPILNNKKSLLGVKFISGGWDKYDDEVVALFFYGPSYAHYLDIIGKGLFIHTDLGIANLVYNESKIGEKVIDESGFAGRIGIGYAVPTFRDASFIFSLHNTSYVFDIGKVNALSFNVGLLW